MTVAYFPQEATVEYYEDFFDRQSTIINDTYMSEKHYIVGDFNKSCIEWSSIPGGRHLRPTKFQGEIPETMIRNFCFSNLSQFNNVRNHQDKLLDLLLSNADDSSVIVDRDPNPLFLPVDDYHPPLSITIKIDSLTLMREIPIEKLNYYKANYGEINERLAGYDWGFLLAGNVNEITNKFYIAIRSAIKDMLPKKVIKKDVYPIFFLLELILLLERKSAYHRKWKRYKNRSDYARFSALRIEARGL